MDFLTILPYVLQNEFLIQWIITVPIIVFVTTFVLYVIVACISNYTKGKWYRKLFIPLLIVFVILDWFANWYCMSIFYLEFPAKADNLVTARLKRYQRDYPTGSYKHKTARALCKLLNIFDKDHC